MTKLEAEYKKKIVDAFLGEGGYATRVEDQYRVGLLDLILILPSTGTVLAEAKRFEGTFFEPSPRQWIEMTRIDSGGGTALLIGVKKEIHYLAATVYTDGHRGRVTQNEWVKQREGEDFPDLFRRWYKEQVRVR